MKWRVYMWSPTNEVERMMASTTTAMISPLCDGGSTKLDFTPGGGFAPCDKSAFDDMEDRGESYSS